MNDIIPMILLSIAIFCSLFLGLFSLDKMEQHRNNHKIHFQKKEISEKEKLEIQILKQRLKKLREENSDK